MIQDATLQTLAALKSSTGTSTIRITSMSVAFLYPGQGAQFAGMLHQLPDRAEVDETLQEASQALGHEVQMLDTEKALSSTAQVQLALTLADFATEGPARTLYPD
jgi:malonyl CoA-acyl carrier protein transacylase